MSTDSGSVERVGSRDAADGQHRAGVHHQRRGPVHEPFGDTSAAGDAVGRCSSSGRGGNQGLARQEVLWPGSLFPAVPAIRLASEEPRTRNRATCLPLPAGIRRSTRRVRLAALCTPRPTRVSRCSMLPSRATTGQARCRPGATPCRFWLVQSRCCWPRAACSSGWRPRRRRGKSWRLPRFLLRLIAVPAATGEPTPSPAVMAAAPAS